MRRVAFNDAALLPTGQRATRAALAAIRNLTPAQRQARERALRVLQRNAARNVLPPLPQNEPIGQINQLPNGIAEYVAPNAVQQDQGGEDLGGDAEEAYAAPAQLVVPAAEEDFFAQFNAQLPQDEYAGGTFLNPQQLASLASRERTRGIAAVADPFSQTTLRRARQARNARDSFAGYKVIQNPDLEGGNNNLNLFIRGRFLDEQNISRHLEYASFRNQDNQYNRNLDRQRLSNQIASLGLLQSASQISQGGESAGARANDILQLPSFRALNARGRTPQPNRTYLDSVRQLQREYVQDRQARLAAQEASLNTRIREENAAKRAAYRAQGKKGRAPESALSTSLQQQRSSVRQRIGFLSSTGTQLRGVSIAYADRSLTRAIGIRDLVERSALINGGRGDVGSYIDEVNVTLNSTPFIQSIEALTVAVRSAVVLTSRNALERYRNRRQKVRAWDDNDLITISIEDLDVHRGGVHRQISVTTGAVTYGQLRNSNRSISDMLFEALQSGDMITPENDFRIFIQFMWNPTIGYWHPRFEIESFFISGVVRYVNPEVYEDASICLPVAVLCSACREINEDGSVTDFQYVPYEFDDRAAVNYFDIRDICKKNVQDQQRYHIKQMANDFIELCGLRKSALNIESLAVMADMLSVKINVTQHDAEGKRIRHFGTGHRFISIMIYEDHAFPVCKPWRVHKNGTPAFWCDKCHESRGHATTAQQMKEHRISCNGDSNVKHVTRSAVYTASQEYVSKRTKPVWDKQTNAFKQQSFCLDCHCFCHEEVDGDGDIATLEYSNESHLEQHVDNVSSWHRSTCDNLMEHNIAENTSVGTCIACGEILPIEFDPSRVPAQFNHLQFINRHQCFMPKPNLKIGISSTYWVWDIETMSINFVHTPIYIYARNLYDATQNFECFNMDEFCLKVFDVAFKGTTWIAHNSGGFDSNFVHRWLEQKGFDHTRIPSPTSLHRSLETYYKQLDIRFIDSYNFIPMALAKIGPSFNLSVHKGDFPHRFSTLDHLAYEGPMPACDTVDDWYSLSTLRASSSEKGDAATTKFKAWHAEESLKYTPTTTTPWNYMYELKRYCKLDCDVLAGALICLRDTFMDVEDVVSGQGITAFKIQPVDPLSYLTMAQVCQKLYIGGLYAANSTLRIAHIPLPDRLSNAYKVRWLMDEQTRIQKKIWQAATMMREWLADDGRPVDGFAHYQGKRHVWEYLNCHEHGCLYCTRSDEAHSTKGVTNAQIFLHTEKRLAKLRGLGYIVHTRWSHEEEDNMQDIQETPEHFTMVGQRQNNDGGFYGGRVEVFKPYWDTQEGEKINYIDVVSLYPWVCATQKMCTGHPNILFGADIDMSKIDRDHEEAYFGYAHVIVKGTEDDYFGGLPRRDTRSGRLLFDNSKTYRTICFIDELRERMDNGLILDKVLEVWDFPQHTSTVGPMAGYVAHFLRDKMECSGWKALCGRVPENEAEKKEICDHLEQENLGLCRPREDKIADNPGGRQLAKLRLNMLWGKFVQCPRAQTQEFISSYEEYLKLWYNPQIDKTTLMFRKIRKDFLEVRYSFLGALRSPMNTHYYLGGSCTAQARLKLTSMLRRIGKDRALYCDTDSAIYVQRPGDEVIETGEALGQWSSELDDGVWGVQFMALAPKCYCLVYNEEGKVREKESALLKAKGVTMTVENHKVVHAASLRNIILNEVYGNKMTDTLSVQAKTFNIRMNHGSDDLEMMNMYGEKIVRCVYSKRKIVKEEDVCKDDVHFIDTVPFCN